MPTAASAWKHILAFAPHLSMALHCSGTTTHVYLGRLFSEAGLCVGHPTVTVDKDNFHIRKHGEALTKQAACLQKHIRPNAFLRNMNFHGSPGDNGGQTFN